MTMVSFSHLYCGVRMDGEEDFGSRPRPPPLAPRLKYIYLHSRLVHLSCIYPEIKVAGEVDAEVPTVHDRTAIGGPDARGEFFRRFWTNMLHHTFDKMKGANFVVF
jgi:hypothetical protein